ncbi:hypothetical protein HYPSUDRAFT_44323 [Hypholoma sublateritium FD-334 SS-4]|uniref:Uncharacterized protein n=1 Tax=Hypholoma sublateritium (strain FD-334 SS-4) TaxID=945553 RepID=A0A0D2PGZ9_HYPSF|nr:hypothetical protein HYPSUDRAFT_44323 [Hypholoma sublateritium FD-334 SS-4]
MPDPLPLYAPPNVDALAEIEGLAVLYKLAAMEDIIEDTCGSEDLEKAIDTV